MKEKIFTQVCNKYLCISQRKLKQSDFTNLCCRFKVQEIFENIPLIKSHHNDSLKS